ncbi:MAG TPA: ABC transporter substrate-binding protein [Acidimicrobiales bacterium]|nr:ABC transporter substrate-binding protein [Acidimicrobiales bacterium]
MTNTTLKVGAIFPVSGPQGQFFSAVGGGILARFHAQNNDGGIGGRQLLLVPADDGDGEVENQLSAQHLVSNSRVFGIIEVTTNSDGSGEYLSRQGIPVTGWGITPAWGRYTNMFGYRYSTSPKANGEPTTTVAAFIEKHGGGRVAVLAGGAAASVNFANQIIETLPYFGLKLAYKNLDEPLGATDYSFDAGAMRRANVDTLVTALDTISNIKVYMAAAAVGLHFKIGMLPAGYDSRLSAADGTLLEGAYVAIDWRPFEVPVYAQQEFKQNLAAVAPGEFPGQLAMVGWLSADAFIRGLQAAGAACPTRTAFISNLRRVKDYTAGGLLPKTNFSAVFGKMPLCYWELEFHGNAFKPASAEPFCGELFKRYRR